MPFDIPEYELFLPHHTNTKHRVMAVTGFPAHPQIHALATLPDALSARRLADALNSTLLNRPNHIERLAGALAGLPDSIQAAVRQLPLDLDDAHVGRPPLGAHVYAHPIDGLMLFPSSSCTPGQCADCEDCANDCTDCRRCADFECDDCAPPDLTPRTADALVTACGLNADNCFDAVDAESRHNPEQVDRADLPLPRLMHHQSADFIRNMARAFDDLADDLLNGGEPYPRSMAEQIALDLAIDLARALSSDDELHTGDGLPTTAYDFNFDAAWEALFEDDDHIGYRRDAEPDPPGTLDYLFEPFRKDNDRDPGRGYRR